MWCVVLAPLVDDSEPSMVLLEDAEAGTTAQEVDVRLVIVEEGELPMRVLDAWEVSLLASLTLDELADGLLDIVFVI